jgi:hypothetical protein
VRVKPILRSLLDNNSIYCDYKGYPIKGGPFHTSTTSRYNFSTTFCTPICAVTTAAGITPFSGIISLNDVSET